MKASIYTVGLISGPIVRAALGAAVAAIIASSRLPDGDNPVGAAFRPPSDRALLGAPTAISRAPSYVSEPAHPAWWRPRRQGFR